MGRHSPGKDKGCEMNSAKTLAKCTLNLVNALCENCNYFNTEDEFHVKCSKSEYCNLKEIRILIDEILKGNK
jgi:hypothetical protein